MQVESIALMSICELQGEQQWFAKIIVALNAAFGVLCAQIACHDLHELYGECFQLHKLQAMPVRWLHLQSRCLLSGDSSWSHKGVYMTCHPSRRT